MISTVELASTEIMSWEAGSANTRIRFEAQVMQDLDVFIEQTYKGDHMLDIGIVIKFCFHRTQQSFSMYT